MKALVQSAPVNYCHWHGVSSIGKRKKACIPSCVILRSDYCQEHVRVEGGWGHRQCARRPLGNGLCKQHGTNNT